MLTTSKSECGRERDEVLESPIPIIFIVECYKPSSSNKADKQESLFSIASVYPIFLPFIDETEIVTCCG